MRKVFFFLTVICLSSLSIVYGWNTVFSIDQIKESVAEPKKDNNAVPIYNEKNMDYESFLHFSGVMEKKDYDGDGLKDLLKRKVIANTQEALYYIEFTDRDSILFLGQFEQGYRLAVDNIDIDSDGKNELISVGMNDHTYNDEDTATFEIYKQNIWNNTVYWDLIRIPKGVRLMEQGLDWQHPQTYQKKAGFDYILKKDIDNYKIVLDEPGQDSWEWKLENVDLPNELSNLVGANIARPAFKFSADENSQTDMLLYQNIGTSQIKIGTIITSIHWNTDGTYTVQNINFKKITN